VCSSDLDRAPDQRVLGFTARVALELSKAHAAAATSAPDVRRIVAPDGERVDWAAPAPDKLRQVVGGTPCDLDPSKLKASAWVPMPSAGQVAAANVFLNDKVMCEELSSWRKSLAWDGNGCCNLGCGTGLQYVVCRVCGVVEQESGKKHLATKASRAVHDARVEEQRTTTDVRDKMRDSAAKAGTIMGKRERSLEPGGKPWEPRSAGTRTGHSQMRAKQPVTSAPSVTTQAVSPRSSEAAACSRGSRTDRMPSGGRCRASLPRRAASPRSPHSRRVD
jgi:hypothetical protein